MFIFTALGFDKYRVAQLYRISSDRKMHFLRILPRKSITTSIRHEYIQKYIETLLDV